MEQPVELLFGVVLCVNQPVHQPLKMDSADSARARITVRPLTVPRGAGMIPAPTGNFCHAGRS